MDMGSFNGRPREWADAVRSALMAQGWDVSAETLLSFSRGEMTFKALLGVIRG